MVAGALVSVRGTLIKGGGREMGSVIFEHRARAEERIVSGRRLVIRWYLQSRNDVSQQIGLHMVLSVSRLRAIRRKNFSTSTAYFSFSFFLVSTKTLFGRSLSRSVVVLSER